MPKAGSYRLEQVFVLAVLMLGSTSGLAASADSPWTLVPTSSAPAARNGASAVVDSAGDRLIVFGGDENLLFGAEQNDVWSYSLSNQQWSPISATGPAPDPRSGASAIFDPKRNRLIVYGGVAGRRLNFHEFQDTWALSLGAQPSWSQLGDRPFPPPSGASGTCAAYDPVGDQMIVFGGQPGVGAPMSNTTWSLDLASGTWSELTTAGTPPTARGFAGAAWDAARRRMIVFGGVNSQLVAVPDDNVWALTLDGTPTWSVVPDGGVPPGLPANFFGGGCLIDPARDRIVALGGDLPDSMIATFPLAGGGTWTRITIAGHPLARFDASIGLDEPRHRLIMFGGAIGTVLTSETWSLALDAPTPVRISFVAATVGNGRIHLEWQRGGVGSSAARVQRCEDGSIEWIELGAAVEVGRDLLTYDDASVEPGHTYRYRLYLDSEGALGETSVLAFPSSPTRWLTASPNPSSGPWRLHLSLPRGERASLEMFDCSGGRLGRWGVEPGRVPPSIELPPGARAGVYLLRLRAAAHVESLRLLLVR